MEMQKLPDPPRPRQSNARPLLLTVCLRIRHGWALRRHSDLLWNRVGIQMGLLDSSILSSKPETEYNMNVLIEKMSRHDILGLVALVSDRVMCNCA